MSDLIRTTREELGLTGAQLGERLGVTVGAISQMERSERDGRIKLDTLERALGAMGRRISIGTTAASAYADYAPAAVTDQVNDALDQRDQSYALRLITHAAQVVAESGDEFADADLARGRRRSRTTDGSNCSGPSTGERSQRPGAPTGRRRPS